MQQHPDTHILQELNGLYSQSEISVIRQLILKEISGHTFNGATSGKINHFSATERRKAEDIVRRLKGGEPIQYILGKTEFYGMPFVVTPDVLIPRPETEELTEWVLSAQRPAGCRALDIGTGSGCIAVTLAKKMNNAVVSAWDISEKALKVASENARLHGVDVWFSVRDIFQPFDGCPVFDVIVSNPPYITEAEKATMEATVLDFEPHEALFVPDCRALLFYERIAALSLKWLRNGGELYFEINREKGAEVCGMLQDKGFTHIELRKDISGNERMVKAEKQERV